MSVFPSSAMGLPASLKYDLPPSLPDSARSYSVNVAPDGITSVSLTGAVGGASANLFVANSTGAFGNFTSQMVSFTLPSGMSQSVFLDPASTTLSFTMQYTVATASAGGVGLTMNLIGSAASFFDTLVLYSNNVPIETINAYGLLQNLLIANTVNYSERTGGLSICMGCDTNAVNGVEIAHATAASYRLNFTIPLLSVIGANTSDKFIPIGSLNNVQLQLQTANIMPIASYCTTVATTQPVINAFSLSEFTLNMKYIDVGDMASQLLAQTLVDGKWFIKAQTYTQSSVTLPANSSGSQQLLLQIRNTSLKSVVHQFGITQSAACPNGYYDAINPGLTSRQLQVGGFYYPNKPINDCGRPSEGYPYLIQSLTQGGSITKSYGTSITRDMYNAVFPTLPTNSDMACVVPGAGVRIAYAGSDNGNTIIIKWPNSAFYGYDLEKSSGILFQGINSRSAPPFLNLFLGASTGSNTILLNAWGISDVILQIDVVAKEIKAFI